MSVIETEKFGTIRVLDQRDGKGGKGEKTPLIKLMHQYISWGPKIKFGISDAGNGKFYLHAWHEDDPPKDMRSFVRLAAAAKESQRQSVEVSR